MEDVFAYIERHRARFLDELCALLRQPSVSTEDRGVRECAELVRRQMAEAGLDARLVPTAGYPVVFGEAGPPSPCRTVLVYGHYDVQPPEPLDRWDTPPFEPSIRNGRIYARGAGDNKGQLFAHVKAVEAVLRTRGTLPVGVKLCYEGEEAVSSPSFPAFVDAYRDLLAADLVYASDGPHDEATHAPNESTTVEGFINGIRSTAAALFELARVREGARVSEEGAPGQGDW